MNMDVEKTDSILNEVLAERIKQHEKWGQQELPIHYPSENYWFENLFLDNTRKTYEYVEKEGTLNYRQIIDEEYWEVWAARTLEEQRAEAVQLAACVVQMIERIDRMREVEK